MSGAVIREMFAVIDAADYPSLREIFHPEIVYRRPGYPPLDGIESVLAFYQHDRVIAVGRHTLSAVVSEGQHAACSGRFVGTHKNGGAIDEEFADVYEFAGSRIIRRQSFFFRPAV